MVWVSNQVVVYYICDIIKYIPNIHCIQFLYRGVKKLIYKIYTPRYPCYPRYANKTLPQALPNKMNSLEFLAQTKLLPTGHQTQIDLIYDICLLDNISLCNIVGAYCLEPVFINPRVLSYGIKKDILSDIADEQITHLDLFMHLISNKISDISVCPSPDSSPSSNPSLNPNPNPNPIIQSKKFNYSAPIYKRKIRIGIFFNKSGLNYKSSLVGTLGHPIKILTLTPEQMVQYYTSMEELSTLYVHVLQYIYVYINIKYSGYIELAKGFEKKIYYGLLSAHMYLFCLKYPDFKNNYYDSKIPSVLIYSGANTCVSPSTCTRCDTKICGCMCCELNPGFPNSIESFATNKNLKFYCYACVKVRVDPGLNPNPNPDDLEHLQNLVPTWLYQYKNMVLVYNKIILLQYLLEHHEDIPPEQITSCAKPNNKYCKCVHSLCASPFLIVKTTSNYEITDSDTEDECPGLVPVDWD